MLHLRSAIHATHRGGILGSSWGQAAETTASGYGVPTTRDGAVKAGGVAAAGACTAYGGAAVAPACAAAGQWVMDSVVLPVAEGVYSKGKALVFGSEETDAQVAYKEAVKKAHNEAWAALRAKLSPLFPGAYAPRMEALIRWYLIDAFEALQKEHGVWGAPPAQLDAKWQGYEKALSAFVAPGGGRDQELAARTAQLLAEQKQETGFDPVPAESPPAGPLFTPGRLAAGAAALFAAWYFLLRKKRR